MKNYKAVELVVVCANIVSNGGPVLHREVTGIQKGVEFNNSIENAVALKCASGKEGRERESKRSEGGRLRGREKKRRKVIIIIQ